MSATHLKLALISLLVLLSSLSARAQNGTWTNSTSGGMWSGTTNWSAGIVADGSGFTAKFNTVDITANNTVHLDSARTLTSLIFGDTSTASPAGWTLDNNGNATNTLTLAGAPTIVVGGLATGMVANISAEITGASSFSKSGAGVLELSGSNSMTGNVVVGANGGSLVVSGSLNSLAGNFWCSLGTSFTLNGGSIIDSTSASYSGAGTGVTLNGNININSGTFTRSSATGSSGLGVNGATTWIQSGGNVTLNGGGLTGTGFATAVTVSGGNLSIATLWNLSGASGSGNGTTLTVSGTGLVNVTGTGALNYSTNGNNPQSTVNLNTGGTLIVHSIVVGGTTSSGQVLNFNGGTLTAGATNASFLNSSGNLTANVRDGGAKIDTAGFNISVAQALVHSTIGGDSATDGGLTKIGAGSLTVSGGNTYTGTTTVSAGSLIIAIGGAINTSSGITVSNGATINNASGITITPALTLEEGSALVTSAASSAFGPTTFSFTGNLSDGWTAIALTNTAGSGLIKGGAFTMTLSGITAGTYNLTSGSGFSGSFASMNINGNPLTASGSDWFGTNIGGFNYTYTNAANQLLIGVYPEPAAWILTLIGLTVTILIGRRRNATSTAHHIGCS